VRSFFGIGEGVEFVTEFEQALREASEFAAGLVIVQLTAKQLQEMLTSRLAFRGCCEVDRRFCTRRNERIHQAPRRKPVMAMKRYKPEQIVILLRRIEVGIVNGKTTPQACKEAEITVQTLASRGRSSSRSSGRSVITCQLWVACFVAWCAEFQTAGESTVWAAGISSPALRE
jgi:hypothetical protein